MHSRLARCVLAALLCAALVPIGGGAAFAERWIDAEFPVSLADYGQVQPAIDYPFLVYKSETDSNGEFTDIWGYNLETGESFPICLAAGEQANPSVSDGKVVYSDDRQNNPDGCNIYLYDLATGEESVVASNTEAEGNPFILGDRVLFNHWEEDGPTGGDIHMVDLSTGVESTLCADLGNQREPTMWGEYAAWKDEASGNDVTLYDFAEDTKITFDSGSAAYNDPMVGDGAVVWSRSVGGVQSIHMYDIESSVVTTISTVTNGSRWHPEVKDGWVVWPDRRSGAMEVWGYNLDSQEETRLVEAVADPQKYAGRATTGAGWLAWHDHRDEGINTDGTSNDDLYVKWIGEGAAPTQEAPLFGDNRYQTAVDVSVRSFPDGADMAVIATGENWPDALAGASFAGANHAPILLVGDMQFDRHANDLPEVVADELTRLGVGNVCILGGEDAISADVEAELESLLETDTVRFAGVDRYDTACIIASATVDIWGDGWDGTCFVTTGNNWPDALAASPLASWAGYPVFLADEDGVPEATQDCMDSIGVTGALVLGGTVAVPVSVFSQMQVAGVTELDRIGGNTRYETAALISAFGVNELDMSYDTLGIATGTNFPDALALGAPLGMDGYTMMINPGDYLHSTTKAAIEAHAADISQIRFAGGSAAIKDEVRAAIMECAY